MNDEYTKADDQSKLILKFFQLHSCVKKHHLLYAVDQRRVYRRVICNITGVHRGILTFCSAYEAG